MDIQSLIARISKLTTKEQKHFYRILIKNNISYSKNLNGYFFNLGNADDSILEELKKCLELIEPNRELIKELDLQREELREKYTSIIKERLLKRQQALLESYENKIIIREYSSIKMEFQKVEVKKRVYFSEKDDVDEIIKKLRKKIYNKNSIYYPIIQKMKKKAQKKKEIDDNFGDYDYDAVNVIDNEDIIKNELDYDIEGEHNDDDLNILEVEDKEIISDVISEEDPEEDDTLIKKLNEYKPNDKYDKDDENEDFEEKDNEDENNEFQEQILYYRKLLNQKLGFQFDENKYCKLIYQDYIPEK
jgi:hypothetical protein